MNMYDCEHMLCVCMRARARARVSVRASAHISARLRVSVRVCVRACASHCGGTNLMLPLLYSSRIPAATRLITPINTQSLKELLTFIAYSLAYSQ